MRNTIALAFLTGCVALTAAFAEARGQLTPADQAQLKSLVAQHQRVRSRLTAEHQTELDQLTLHVRKHLFAAPPRSKLLPSAARIVSQAIPGLTSSEATSLAEYTLGGIAGGELLNATKQMQETQMSFNLQYLQLQSQMQNENRSYTAVSNIMKTKHDTVKNSISNIR